jgi:hypothetical protein
MKATVRPPRRAIRTATAALLLALASSWAGPAAWARENPRLAGVDYQVANYAQPETRERLARFDLLVLGFWRAYGKPRVAAIVDDLRRRHPGIVLGQYTALNEVPGGYEKFDANSDLVAKLDREGWWLRDAAGRKVQWTSAYNAFDVNLTAFSPPDADGLRWPEWKARRDVQAVFSQWPSLDFVFVDNVFERPRDRAVWRPGGREAAGEDAEVAAAMREGYAGYWSALRKLQPGLKVVGNVDHDLTAPEYRGAPLDGAFLESLIGHRWSLESTRGWPQVMQRYRTVSRQVRDPRLVVFHVTGDPTDYRLMRFGLATCLMGEGLFAFNDNGRSPPWFDEYDVDLGAAEGAAAEVPGSSGVWMRRFRQGLVLVNPGPAPALVSVPPGYSRLKGSQAPDVNDGSPVREVRLPPRDGLLLVRAER